MQPKPQANKKHKAWKKQEKPDEEVKARAAMLHQVHKVSAKGKVKEEPEERDETAAEEQSEEEGYNKGGYCMSCGGKLK